MAGSGLLWLALLCFAVAVTFAPQDADAQWPVPLPSNLYPSTNRPRAIVTPNDVSRLQQGKKKTNKNR